MKPKKPRESEPKREELSPEAAKRLAEAMVKRMQERSAQRLYDRIGAGLKWAVKFAGMVYLERSHDYANRGSIVEAVNAYADAAAHEPKPEEKPV